MRYEDRGAPHEIQDPSPEQRMSVPDDVLLSPPTGEMPLPPPRNTSGTGRTAVVPSELAGRNVAAFFITLIWCGPNRAWPAFLAAVPAVLYPFPLIPRSVLGLSQLVIGAWASRNGNRWAWRYRRWESVEHFTRVQRRWAWATIPIVVASIIATAAVQGLDGASTSADPTSDVSGWRSFSKQDVSFRYPEAWEIRDAEDLFGLDMLGKGWIWAEVLVVDEHDKLLIAEVEWPWVTDASNIDLVGRVLSKGLDVTAGPERRSIDDSTGIGFTFAEADDATGETMLQMNVAFDRTTSYLIGCASTPEYVGEADRACAIVLDSFSITERDDALPPDWTSLGSAPGPSISIPPGWRGAGIAGRRIKAVSTGARGVGAAVVGNRMSPGMTLSMSDIADDIGSISGPATRIVDRTNVTLPAGDGVLVHLKDASSTPLSMTVYYLQVDARTYRLVFLTLLHRQPLLAPTFDAIARTFSVP